MAPLLLYTISLLISCSCAIQINQMELYMHESFGPTNATLVRVAGPQNGSFGAVSVIDDILTKGPSISSKIMGRAKGTFISDDSTNTTVTGVFVSIVAVLEDGSISMQGQNNIFDEVREIAVTGGTGAYRFASGYAQIRTYKVTPPNSAILNLRVFYKN